MVFFGKNCATFWVLFVDVVSHGMAQEGAGVIVGASAAMAHGGALREAHERRRGF